MPIDWLTPDLLYLLLCGLLLTVVLTGVTAALALAVGIAAGTMRLSGNRLVRGLAVVHVEMHRNMPALVLMIIWAFALPNLFPAEMRRGLFFDNDFLDWISRWSGLSLPYYTLAAGVALVLNTSAYLAELFRAGVGAIPQQHVDAARTLGASRLELFRQVPAARGPAHGFPGHIDAPDSSSEEHCAGCICRHAGVLPQCPNRDYAHISGAGVSDACSARLSAAGIRLVRAVALGGEAVARGQWPAKVAYHRSLNK